MLYIVEFAFAAVILIAVALWGISLVSPVLCAVGYLALAVWLIRNGGLAPAAVSGIILALLLSIRLVV